MVCISITAGQAGRHVGAGGEADRAGRCLGRHRQLRQHAIRQVVDDDAARDDPDRVGHARVAPAERHRHGLDLVRHAGDAVGDEETVDQRADDRALGRHQHGVARDPAQVERLLLQQRMVRPHDERDALRIEMLEAEAGHQLRIGEAADHQVEIAGAQLRQQHRIVAGDHAHHGAGVLLLEQADRQRHDPGRDGRQRADLDRHAALGARLGDGIDALAQRRDAGARHSAGTPRRTGSARRRARAARTSATPSSSSSSRMVLETAGCVTDKAAAAFTTLCWRAISRKHWRWRYLTL